MAKVSLGPFVNIVLSYPFAPLREAAGYVGPGLLLPLVFEQPILALGILVGPLPGIVRAVARTECVPYLGRIIPRYASSATSREMR